MGNALIQKGLCALGLAGGGAGLTEDYRAHVPGSATQKERVARREAPPERQPNLTGQSGDKNSLTRRERCVLRHSRDAGLHQSVETQVSNKLRQVHFASAAVSVEVLTSLHL